MRPLRPSSAQTNLVGYGRVREVKREVISLKTKPSPTIILVRRNYVEREEKSAERERRNQPSFTNIIRRTSKASGLIT